MALEIERKYLVTSQEWRRRAGASRHLVDHLIARFSGGKARIRICDSAFTLTIKGARTGIARREFHMELAEQDALEMIAEFSAAPPVEKRRHEVRVEDLVWQVDEFLGPLNGLVTADVELPSAEWPVAPPPWVGRDITGDPRFGTTQLIAMLEHHQDSMVSPWTEPNRLFEATH